MIVHILGSATMFTKDTYEMISKYFNNSPHEHVFISKFPNHENYEYGNCKVIKSKSIKMLIALYKADYIVVHGLINKLVVFLLTIQPWLIKKCGWVVWGGDIYIHNKKNKNIKERIIEYFKCYIIPKFPVIITVSDGDYQLAQKWYGAKGKECQIVYPTPASKLSLLNRVLDVKKDKDVINIIVGNSATETNQHFEALKLLEKFKNDNIRIHLPLSYGTGDFTDYANKVIEFAKSIFGDKVEPLRKQIPGDEYLYYLKKMDIGIFNNNRQQAMGNISQLILCGAKVYLRTDTKMWNHFKKLGCELSDIYSIDKMLTLDELMEYDLDIKRKNVDIIFKRHSIETKIEQWTNMFNLMEQECR